MGSFALFLCVLAGLFVVLLAGLCLPSAGQTRYRERRAYSQYELDGMRALVRASWLSGFEEMRTPPEERDANPDPFGPCFRKHLEQQFRLLRGQRH